MFDLERTLCGSAHFDQADQNCQTPPTNLATDTPITKNMAQAQAALYSQPLSRGPRPPLRC